MKNTKLNGCLALEEIEALATGGLKPRRAEAARVHVSGCPKCHAALEEAQANEILLAVLARSLVHEPPDPDQSRCLQTTETKVAAFLLKHRTQLTASS